MDGKHECIWCPWVGVAPEWGREGGKTVGEGLPVAAFSWTLESWGSLEEEVASCPIVQDFIVSQEYLLCVGFQ